MKVLFINAYFYPEKIAFTHLEKDIMETLLENGYEIKVLCPIPTRGITPKVKDEYKNKKYEKIYNNKIEIIRFWAPQEGKNPIMRAFRYLWCNFRQYQIGKKIQDCDLIFSVSTPPTQGMLAGKLAKKLGIPHIYSLQDIFPDSLINSKLAKKNGILWKIGRRIEDFTYKNADKIIVISESMKSNILNKGASREKIEVVSNWIDTKSVTPIKREENILFKELKLNTDDFIVVYAGNFGAAQGTDIIISAARALKNYPKLKFVIFGGGPYFETTKEMVKDMDNIIIKDLFPLKYVSQVYSLGNIALITCKKGTGVAGMPSKTWSIMACNTPIIASFDIKSELNNILKKSNAGKCVEAEDVEELSKAILEEYKYYLKNGIKKINSREFVEKYASKEVCVKKYINIIKYINRSGEL